MASPWKSANVAGKVALLRPLLAQGLKTGRIAQLLGTTSGAVAGFIHYHPEVRETDGRLYFGDGVTSARISVRLKAAPQPEPPVPAAPVDAAADDAAPFRPRAPRGRVLRMPRDLSSERPGDAPAVTAPTLAPEPAVPDAGPADVAEDLFETPIARAANRPEIPVRSLPGGRVLLIDSGHFRCKWPTWPNGPTPSGADAISCGAPVSAGHPYCDAHCRLAYPAYAARAAS